MPERNKGEDREKVEDLAGFGFYAAAAGATAATTAAAAKRDVQIAYDPAVEGAVPGTPEGKCGVVIRHAARHVLRWIDAVDQRPKAEEAPRDEELQPDDVEIEVGHHAELRRSVEGPVRGGFGDGHDVDVVQDEFHAEEGEQEAGSVEKGAEPGDRRRSVSLLRDVVIES